MGAWIPDLLLSGWPWAESSGVLAAELMLANDIAPTEVANPASTLTYKLYNGSTLLFTTSATVIADTGPGIVRFRTAYTLTTALDPKIIYREVWSGTVASSSPGTSSTTVSQARDVYPTPYPLRRPPVTSTAIALTSPVLATVFTSVETWVSPINLAWFELCRWVTSQGYGAVWTPARLALAHYHLTLHYIHTSRAIYGSASAAASAVASRTAYAVELETARIGWDTDGDGDHDKTSAGSDAGGGGV